MQKLLRSYLRILDIDPFGRFVRLVNTSRSHALDLSQIHLCQRNVYESSSIVHSYTFSNDIRPLLKRGETVAIHSRADDRVQFDIAPYMVVARRLARWSTENHMRTELSIDGLTFDRYRFCSLSTNNVPFLLIHRSVPRTPPPPFESSTSTRETRCCFPYCTSIDNAVNPHVRVAHTQAPNSVAQQRQTTDTFDSYPRRLTTAPKEMRSLPYLPSNDS